jgi:hypothetical protein
MKDTINKKDTVLEERSEKETAKNNTPYFFLHVNIFLNQEHKTFLRHHLEQQHKHLENIVQ